jgi:hypothetical protein
MDTVSGDECDDWSTGTLTAEVIALQKLVADLHERVRELERDHEPEFE